MFQISELNPALTSSSPQWGKKALRFTHHATPPPFSKSVFLAWPPWPEDGFWLELLPLFLNTSAFSLLHPMAQSPGLISHPQLVRFIFQKKAKLFICVNSALGTHKLTERKQSHILSFQNGSSVLLQEDLPSWGRSPLCLA